MNATRVVAFDVDGTLLDQAGLFPGVPDILRQLSDSGAEIAICSARPLPSLINLTELIGVLPDYLSALQGAEVYSWTEGSWAPISVKPISRPTGRRIVGWCQKAEVEYWWYQGTQWFVAKQTDRVRAEMASVGMAPTVDAELVHLDTPSKILALASDEQMDAAHRALQMEPARLMRSHSDFMEIVATEAGECKGLDRIMDHAGAVRSTTTAVGDGPNDVGMWRVAGTALRFPSGVSFSSPAHTVLLGDPRRGGVQQLARILGQG